MIATISKPAAGEILIQGFTFLNAYRDNPNDWGAAILLDLGDTSAIVDSCVFRDNAAAAAIFSGHFKRIENCTVADNALDALMTNWWFFIVKSILRVYHTDASTSVVNCISWNNQISAIGARTERYPRQTVIEVPSSSYSIFESAMTGSGNLVKDPLFNNVPAADYSLKQGSPARNSGDPSSTKNADGSRADMGARLMQLGTR